MANNDAYQERMDQALDPTNTPPGRSNQPPEDDESLLVMEPTDAAKTMMRDWDESWKDIRGITEQWRVNKARADGYTGVTIVKRENKSEAHIPMGAKKAIQGLNKAARLCRAIGSALFADPPKAEATPSTDDDEDRDAAQTSTRVLDDLCSEGNMDYGLASRTAFDRGSVYGSGFVRFWVDETGGGWLPKEIECSPTAQSPDQPFPEGTEDDAITRYVTEDGQLTDDRTAAARVWQPKIKREILTGKHVRFIPFYGTGDIWDADGVMIGAARTLGELKRMFPEIRKWSKDRVAKLVTTRPQHFNELIPSGKKDNAADPSKDESLCFTLTRYHVQGPKYPEGAYLVAAGMDEVLYRGKWFDEMHAEPLDIPLTQFKQLNEEGNPYGSGQMEQLGPGNEVRAQMVGSWLEHLDRFNNRRMFVPLTSTLQAHQLQSPTGTPIPILPGGEPKYEEIPDFPVITEKMLAFISSEMDDESRLQQVGQGLNPASVKSGVHANAIREQVQIGLSDLKENTERGLVRGWRIILQLARAFMNEAQQIRWMGQDGRYKTQRWTNADLRSTKDVRVQKGSFTGLTPIGKANTAWEYAQMGLLRPQDLSHVIEGNVGGMFGLQDNSHRMRVKRQIAEWEEGPPEGWQPQPPQINPQTGQPVPVPDPVLSGIWDVRPSDSLPEAAQIRVYELARAMDGTTFSRWPQEWQAGMVQSFQIAKQAAQVLDAESVQNLQVQGQKLAQELQQTKAKLAEKASVSLPLKPGFGLTPEQVAAVLAQEGIQFPLGGIPEQAATPEADPQATMVADMQKHEMTLKTDLAKHAMTQETELQKAKIGAKTKTDTTKLTNSVKLMKGGAK